MTAAELIAYLVWAIETMVIFAPPLLAAMAAVGLCLLISEYKARKKRRMKNGCNCRFCKNG